MTLQEIEGRWIGERWRNGDFVIGQVELLSGSDLVAEKHGHKDGPLTVKGEASVDEVQCRQSYRFYGQFGEYRGRNGQITKDFAFRTFVPARSHDREGVIAYLEQIGKGLGMGRATAARCWEAFGSDAVKTIREEPRLLVRFGRFTDDQIESIGYSLAAQAKLEDATIELTNLFAGRSIPKATARKAIRAWGNRAAEIIKRDPYRLIKFRGIGFKLADQLWVEFGLRKDRLRRQAMAVWHSLATDSNGHAWFPVEHAESYLNDTIRGARVDALRAVKMATRINRMMPGHYGSVAAIRLDGGAIVDQGGRIFLAEGGKARSECNLADYVVEAANESKPAVITQYGHVDLEVTQAINHARCTRCGRQLTAAEVHIVAGKPYGPTCIGYIDGQSEVQSLADWIGSNPATKRMIAEAPKGRITFPEFSLWPDVDRIANITDHQRDAFAKCLTGRIGILGGSPGTGKTHSLAQLIKATLADGRVGIEDIAVGAPTGKAAVRITENLNRLGVPITAMTWHSLLGVAESGEDGGDWGFAHNRENRWSYRIVFGDEWSMPDCGLAASVFAARPRGCHFLLVGDVNQLPPVGYGAPLRDLIGAGLPYGELTEIIRNDGGIVQACADIRDGKDFEFANNLIHVPAPTAEAQIDAIRRILAKESSEFDPVWDCQILVAVNEKSKVSRVKINEVFQPELNQNPSRQGIVFRIDDKVVCLKNGIYQLASDSTKDVRVANGELGLVEDIEDKSMIVVLSAPERKIRVPFGKKSEDGESGSGAAWDLAYGLTCHKLQGSEAPIVIVLADEQGGRVCSREWVYTAFSRAKVRCYVVGNQRVIRQMCKRTSIGNRRTLLTQLIRKKMCDSIMVDF